MQPANHMIIEYEIPDELLARCAGQALTCKDVLKKYVEQMRDDVALLKQSINAGDAANASKIAHRIKGASANVVAEELRSLGSQIEVLAGDGEITKARVLLDDLNAAWIRFEELISDFLSE